tara:strand:+ start:1510 stop:1926 length:417 start_codon:yes stop_codon:yes gene_type:complete
MDFFEIKKPIRKLGDKYYIIGQDPINPLVKIDGNHLSTNEITVNKLNFDFGQFGSITGESFNITTGSFETILVNGADIGRENLQEAFEIDEDGDVTPTNHANISDTMWILRSNNDLELRSNIWRYDTGPEAFTEDIAF